VKARGLALFVLFIPASAFAASPGLECSSVLPSRDAERNLYAAQSELDNAKGFKEIRLALERVARAQEAYSRSFSCQKTPSGDGPFGRQKAAPKIPFKAVEVPEGYSPFSGPDPVSRPEYSPFDRQDSASTPGIFYTPPAGMQNPRGSPGSQKRGRTVPYAVAAAKAAQREAPAQVLPENAQPALMRAALAPAQGVPAAQRGEAERRLGEAERKRAFGDLAGAILDIERAIRIDPRSAFAYRARARVLSQMGRFEEAQEAAMEALVLSPNDALAHETLAWARLNLGDYAGAVESASRSLALSPKNAFAYAIRAYAHEKLGDRAERTDDIERAAALSPADFAAQAKRVRAGLPVQMPVRADAAKRGLEEKSVPTRGGLGWLLALGALLPAVFFAFWHLRLRDGPAA